jgi:hypothetical protein
MRRTRLPDSNTRKIERLVGARQFDTLKQTAETSKDATELGKICTMLTAGRRWNQTEKTRVDEIVEIAKARCWILGKSLRRWLRDTFGEPDAQLVAKYRLPMATDTPVMKEGIRQ